MRYKDEGICQQGGENAEQKAKLIQFWKKLWSEKIPSKIQMCAWRICHDFLPVRANLFKKKICPQSLCQLCGLDEETVIHAIKECRMASKVQRKTKLDIKWCLTEDSNISSWLSNITKKIDKDYFEFELVVIWTIGNNRNAIVMNGENRDSQRAANFAVTFFKNIGMSC